MDHTTIENDCLIERYHQGSLSAEEEERFEAHFMECGACRQELLVARSLRRGIKTLAAQEATRTALRAAVGTGLLAWLSRHRAATALALTTALVLAAGFGIGHLLRENSRLEARLAGIDGHGNTVAGTLERPLVAVPVVILGILRGNDSPPIIDAEPGKHYSLAIDVGADPRFTSYAVTIVDAAGASPFTRAELLPNDLEVIQLTFTGDYLPAGGYHLHLDGSLPDGEQVEIGRYPFRVAVGDD